MSSRGAPSHCRGSCSRQRQRGHGCRGCLSRQEGHSRFRHAARSDRRSSGGGLCVLSTLLIRSRDGIQYVEHTAGHGEKLFEAVCDLGLEGIMFKRLTSVYRSGPSRTWTKVKNPNAPAATRAMDGTFWKYFIGWTILDLYGFTSSHCSNRVADHDYSVLCYPSCKSDRLAAASGARLATERSKAGRPRLKTND